ncbi:MAG TPA: hypothetical protein VGC13_10265 [Longimicrobium sp.]|jgi:pimeloyl-ACP methyl ester carboxylesterase|uniref:lipase family alpha/beta hydrolase n=1 Tax=Longimicrobium sp. TaxID=2029185 RepID=UPI002ED90FA5
MNTIVVLLPGIAGTSLSHHDDILSTWPLKVARTAVANEPEALRMLEDPSLTPGEPIPWALPITVFDLGYRGFRDYFEAAGFTSVLFSVNNPDLPAEPLQKLLVGFAYDWRQDNSGTAENLRTLLSRLHQLYGGGEYEVFLVGHSMGGLVSRAYLENPAYQKDAWYGRVRALITLGTPHLGAPLAVAGINGTITTEFLAPYNRLVQDFVNESFSVSAYELLPPVQRKFIVGPEAYSIFDPAFRNTAAWAALKEKGLDEAKINRAGEFLAGLDYTGGGALPPYYCVYGLSTLFETCESFTYDAHGTLTEVDDMQGDAVVPKWSASFQGRAVEQIYSPPGGVNHLQLASNLDVLRTVAQWMGVTAPVVHFTGIEVPATAPAEAPAEAGVA